MALYQDGILISGANTLPKLTQAQYDALPAELKPEYWVCLDKDYDDILAEKTDIATVESGTTASRDYSIGELVYVSGTLYRVKTAIASGATFTEGTNVEPTNVSNALMGQNGNIINLYSIIKNGLQRILLSWTGDRLKTVNGTVNGYGSFIVAFFQQNGGSGMYTLNMQAGNITKSHIVGLDNTSDTYFHNEFDNTTGLRFRLSSARAYETEIFIFGIGV